MVGDAIKPLHYCQQWDVWSLSAVMLKLCDPFLDASLSKKGKIEVSYVLQKGRLDFRFQV